MAGHQPNYLPWLGFFDKMLYADVFVIEDVVQYERQGFTNRNKIKTANGVKWLTVPIEHTGLSLPINEVKIAKEAEPEWAKRHWLTLKHHYNKAPFWNKYCDFFEEAYRQDWTLLYDLNMHLIKGLMGFLKIETPLVLASSLGVTGEKGELVLAQCKALGATTQFAGSGSRDYINVELFEKEGVKVVFQDFKYPKYTQVYGEFVPNLSVVDYLFCTGGESFYELRTS